MEGRWVSVASCLLWGLCLMNTASGETVPCVDTRLECQAKGFSSLSIINNQYRCCPAGFSMSVFNTRCTCTRTSEAMNCSVGPQACRNAGSFTSDGQGNTMCCPPGFGLQSSMTSVNGLTSKSCTCTRGGSFQTMSFGGSGVDSAALRERFQAAMKQGMSHLTSGMRSMAHSMSNMRRTMANAFGNIFRG